MPSIVSAIPQRFWDIRFDPDHDVDAPILKSIDESPNCQNFAYEILRHFRRTIPNFRSSNLWEDTNHTAVVSDHQPLDLLLFNRVQKAWGAHIALCVGEGDAIHLSKKLSAPVVWPIARFAEQPEYRVLIGAKRTLR
jgi:murein DD-endopeptidase / murein LD-carboxypeptidase